MRAKQMKKWHYCLGVFFSLFLITSQALSSPVKPWIEFDAIYFTFQGYDEITQKFSENKTKIERFFERMLGENQGQILSQQPTYKKTHNVTLLKKGKNQYKLVEMRSVDQETIDENFAAAYLLEQNRNIAYVLIKPIALKGSSSDDTDDFGIYNKIISLSENKTYAANLNIKVKLPKDSLRVFERKSAGYVERYIIYLYHYPDSSTREHLALEAFVPLEFESEFEPFIQRELQRAIDLLTEMHIQFTSQ